jgi:hypothetical protein
MTGYLIVARAAIVLWVNLAVMPVVLVFGPARGLRRTNAQSGVISGSVPFPDLLRTLLLRRLLLERRTMFARSGTTESDQFAEVVGFKGERHRPSYRFRDAFGCRTITYVQLSR